ncbi:MAG: HTTM domain-containing protein [Archangiaceae bacterium]|nr:HTTM domain-containing protein [Archangiaceae bacterium]
MKWRSWATGHPLDLAVFRITISAVVLMSADVWDAPTWASAAVRAPVGWGFVSALLPASHDAALVALGLVVVFTSLTLLGAFTRVSSVVSALSLVWLLGVPQQSGVVLHTHHLVWFMALVAAGPSGDALSVDAWRRTTSVAPSVAHGLPVRAAWLSIGLLFFFPGVWKLASASVWLEQLPTLVAWKRFQLGLPSLDVSQSFLRVGGVATIAFEVGFIALVVFARTRLVGIVAAFAFHAGVQALLGIRFSSLWSCYLVFLPWSRWLGSPISVVEGKRSTVAPLVVAGALLSAQVLTGVLLNETSWPVACYPTFRNPAPQVVRWLELETDEGVVLSLERMRSGPHQRWWGLSERTAWAPTPAALEQLFTQAVGRPRREGEAARWTVVTFSPSTNETRREPALP